MASQEDVPRALDVQRFAEARRAEVRARKHGGEINVLVGFCFVIQQDTSDGNLLRSWSCCADFES